MSSAELLMVLLVALLVFGPNQLPMLANHLSKILRFAGGCRQKLSDFWESQLNEHQLQENLKKAEQAEKKYNKNIVE